MVIPDHYLRSLHATLIAYIARAVNEGRAHEEINRVSRSDFPFERWVHQGKTDSKPSIPDLDRFPNSLPNWTFESKIEN